MYKLYKDPMGTLLLFTGSRIATPDFSLTSKDGWLWDEFVKNIIPDLELIMVI